VGSEGSPKAGSQDPFLGSPEGAPHSSPKNASEDLLRALYCEFKGIEAVGNQINVQILSLLDS
jgi:hypothetical protein